MLHSKKWHDTGQPKRKKYWIPLRKIDHTKFLVMLHSKQKDDSSPVSQKNKNCGAIAYSNTKETPFKNPYT